MVNVGQNKARKHKEKADPSVACPDNVLNTLRSVLQIGTAKVKENDYESGKKTNTRQCWERLLA